MSGIERALLKVARGARRRLRIHRVHRLLLSGTTTPGPGGRVVRGAVRGTAALVVAAGIFGAGAWWGQERTESRVGTALDGAPESVAYYRSRLNQGEGLTADERSEIEKRIAASETLVYVREKSGVELRLEDRR